MPTWTTIIREAIRNSLDGAQTSCPAIVESYDPETQTATIRLAVTFDPPIPPISDVPVQAAGGSGYFLHFPLSKGDEGIAHFSSKDFAGWRTSGKPSKPDFLQSHGLFAMFSPGLRSDAKAIDLAGQGGIVLGSGNGPALVINGSVCSVRARTDSTDAKAVVVADLLVDWIETVLVPALNVGNSGGPIALVAPTADLFATTTFEAE